MNIFFEIEIGETTTVGDLLEDWLDVTFTGMMMTFLLVKKNYFILSDVP